jgi:membrane protein implicated in regulation of membrane protease activity
LQLEFANPLVGLGMIIIGLFLMVLGYWVYGITPVAVGIALIVLYRKYLMQILGNAD